MDIRQTFLNFFQSKKHELYKSFPLVPDDDSLMFVNAGMVPFKDIFTSRVPTPTNKTATSCQLCLRTGGKHNDLENVGYTNRHHTLFEMLGNFSFGDYFKKEAISYSYEFITEYLKLDKDKLWFTVYDDDDEAYELWKAIVPESRIKRFGDKDNFWQMGNTGPCGPCSEIFYDQGDSFDSDEDYLGGDGDRFLEIWNLVFMQYERNEKGELEKLEHPSIDTGMGLERIYAIKENVFSNFDTSLFMPIMRHIEKITQQSYDSSNKSSFRVIADHIRTICFMLSDGISFDKEGRGYVLRRILRRAVRHGYLLGLRGSFLYLLVDDIISIMSGAYPYLKDKKEFLIENITNEEERFFATIEHGMKIFYKELEQTKDIFSGEIAFKLYDTYGFPLDLTEDMLRESNIQIDIKTYEYEMNKQKEKARSAWSGSGEASKSSNFKSVLNDFGLNEFIGYDNVQSFSKIIALYDYEFNPCDVLDKKGWLILDKTPFYAESGGQVGDTGFIVKDNKNISITNTKKFFDLNISEVHIKDISLNVGETIEAVVENRDEIKKHHSATHLLQTALRIVLGDNVHQAGSYNDSSKLRFDFTYSKMIEDGDISKIENIVNSLINSAIELKTEELDIEKAKQKGAIAMFGEKYGDRVRVVSFDKESVEFCGGTHIENTSKIANFIITKQSSVSSGVRRIEAVCGKSAISFINNLREQYKKVKFELKNDDIYDGVIKLKQNIKKLKTEIKNSNQKSLKELSSQNIKDIYVIVETIDDGDLKEIIDVYKNKYEKVIIFLFQIVENKVKMFCGTKNSPIKANTLIKEIAPILGAKGGGRDDFASAGGGNVDKIDEAKQQIVNYIKGNT